MLGRPILPDWPWGSSSTQFVYFRDKEWVGCWADVLPKDDVGCMDSAVTTIGLCAKHYKEIVRG